MDRLTDLRDAILAAVARHPEWKVAPGSWFAEAESNCTCALGILLVDRGKEGWLPNLEESPVSEEVEAILADIASELRLSEAEMFDFIRGFDRKSSDHESEWYRLGVEVNNLLIKD